MTYEIQHNAIRDRFDTEWAGTTPIAWPNAEFSPPDDADWVRFVLDDAAARQASFGDDTNFYRHTGLVTVMIFTTLNKGDKAALELADQVLGIFRHYVDATNKILFREAPFIRRVGATDRWYHVNALCPFQRDELF